MQFTGLSFLLTVAAAFGAAAARPTEVHEFKIGNITSKDATSSNVERAADYNGRFTYFYQTGQPGACGGYNSDNEYIVALNSDQYGSGQYCWESITISYGGKSTTAAIVDECPGCPYGGLDLTPALFTFLAGSLAPGVIEGTWEFQ